MPFSNFGLHGNLVRAVQDLRFQKPTDIQRDAIPAAVQGRDVLACSATGSGKTAAFLLPLLHQLCIRQERQRRVSVLVLSPTRELAVQIQEHLRELARHTNVSSAAIYGGVSMGPQKQAMISGVDVLIATPGRLLDHLQYSYANLSQVNALVLDEADRMLDMGFLPDVRRILQRLPQQRQTLFFSATMPQEIVRLSREMLRDAVTVNVQRQARPAEGITHTVYPVPHTLKSSLLLKLVQGESVRNALVFARTKRRADRIADYLKKQGVSATRIHGDRTQSQRLQALDGFKQGRYRVLVATDVAARGIDIDALSHVINFDLPGSPEDYIHRVGRTARAEAVGDAFTFVSPDQEGELKAIERALSSKLPRVSLSDFDYTAAPQNDMRGPAEHGERAHHHSRSERPSLSRSHALPRNGRNDRPWEKSARSPRGRRNRMAAHNAR